MHCLQNRLVLGLAGAACALTIAACGGDESSSSGSGSSSSASSDGGTKRSGDLVALQAKLDELSKPPTQIAVSEPVKNPARNKTGAWIVLNAPTAQEAAAGTEEAAKLLGWKVTLIKADPTPASIKSAWSRAAELKPDVVYSVGFPTPVFQEAADKLKAHGTKLVSYAVGQKQSPAPGFDYETESTRSLAEWMKLAAYQIAVEANGRPAKVAGFWMESYATQVGQEQSFSLALKETCPRCSYESTKMNPADIGTKFPGQVVSYLQRKPDTEYIVLGYSPMVTGVEAAVKAAGVGENVKGVLGNGGSKPQWDAMGPDGYLTFDIAKSDRELGWQLFDAGLRLLADQPAPAGVPLYESAIALMTSQNVEEMRKSGYRFNPNYKQQYKTLWGLG